MSLEIEVVADGAAPLPKPAVEAEAPDDIYTAAAYGDLDKLRFLVEQSGCSCVSQPDGGGYYALQWSALNNRAAAAQYLIENGADINAVDRTGQTALHWTGVRGSTQVAELLLQNGANLEIADAHGYRVTHVASQYGQTALLYHIATKWGAEIDAVDNDGRSPLHWAAYKGFGDCVRLLLFMDAYLQRQDMEGCTPLHWAAIRGNLEACTILVQAGSKENLMITDMTGCTPAQLASDKGHRQVALFLSNARRALNNRLDSKGLFGNFARMGLAPVLWLFIITMVATFINSVITASTLLHVSPFVGGWAWLCVFLATGGLPFLYYCSSKDPGYVTINRNNKSSERSSNESLLKSDLSSPALWAGYWSQLCPTCKIVRPLRSKHCSTCNRCVEQFDHHCPWIANCVGKKNKREFFIFLCMESAALIIAAAVTIHRLLSDPNAPSSAWIHYMSAEHSGALAFVIVDIFILFAVVILTGLQAAQVARNITTNEMANSVRYSYLKGPDGRFHNPYDHGCRQNCNDFLLRGYSEDIELPWQLPQQNGIGVVQMVHRSRPSNSTAAASNLSSKIPQNQNSGRIGSTVGGTSSGHGNSATSNHSHGQPNATPLGLGLGLGLVRNAANHHHDVHKL